MGAPPLRLAAAQRSATHRLHRRSETSARRGGTRGRLGVLAVNDRMRADDHEPIASPLNPATPTVLALSRGPLQSIVPLLTHSYVRLSRTPSCSGDVSEPKWAHTERGGVPRPRPCQARRHRKVSVCHRILHTAVNDCGERNVDPALQEQTTLPHDSKGCDEVARSEHLKSNEREGTLGLPRRRGQVPTAARIGQRQPVTLQVLPRAWLRGGQPMRLLDTPGDSRMGTDTGFGKPPMNDRNP